VVDVKTAVKNAMEFAQVSLGEGRTKGLRLEEIDSSTIEGNAVFLVTLSNLPADAGAYSNAFANLAIGADAKREYKIFAVSKESGDVLSMKIRLIAVPA
jgi:hypothetical protein